MSSCCESSSATREAEAVAAVAMGRVGVATAVITVALAGDMAAVGTVATRQTGDQRLQAGPRGARTARCSVEDDVVVVPPRREARLMLTGGKGLEEGARAARRLAEAGRLDEAIAACETLVAVHREDAWGEGDRCLADVLLLECWCLGEQRNFERLLGVGMEMQRRYADAQDGELRAAASLWMYHAVWTLLRADRVPDAIEAGERLIASFEHEHDPGFLALVGEALSDVGTDLAWGEPLKPWPLMVVVLWMLAIADALERLSPLAPPRRSLAASTADSVSDRAARRLRLGGWRYRRARCQQALRSFDVLIERLQGAQPHELQKLLARAQLGRGMALIYLGRLREGWKTFNDVWDGDQQGVNLIAKDAVVRRDARYSPIDLAAAFCALMAPTRETEPAVEQIVRGDRRAITRFCAWAIRRL